VQRRASRAAFCCSPRPADGGHQELCDLWDDYYLLLLNRYNDKDGLGGDSPNKSNKNGQIPPARRRGSK
jgi:hypothetical protein